MNFTFETDDEARISLWKDNRSLVNISSEYTSLAGWKRSLEILHLVHTNLTLKFTFFWHLMIVHTDVLYFKNMFNNMFLYIKKNKSGLPWIFTEPKNCYRLFPMIAWHGTEKLLSKGFEILRFVSCLKMVVHATFFIKQYYWERETFFKITSLYTE